MNHRESIEMAENLSLSYKNDVIEMKN